MEFSCIKLEGILYFGSIKETDFYVQLKIIRVASSSPLMVFILEKSIDL